jgi:DNA (cytosine-5)-methyltransferase 1
MAAYYNEIDLYAAEWLRNLIKAGHIADGEVDTRSIIDVWPEEIKDFDQCHFFAGIAGWSHALRLSGWEDDRKIWTGSCPCQPFSVAGQGKGVNDERHLWPHFFRLIRGCRPPVVMGEQVAGAAGYGWLDGVRSDLESESYACDGVDIPACSINAPHIRQRLYWVAMDNAQGAGLEGRFVNTSIPSIEARDSDIGSASGDSFSMVNTNSERRQEHGRPISVQTEQPSVECSSSGWAGSWESMGSSSSDMADADNTQRRQDITARHDDHWENARREKGSSNHRECCQSNFWHDAILLNGADGKARRSKSGVCLLANGIPARVGKLRAYGNAIVPPLAAEVIKAFMEEIE